MKRHGIGFFFLTSLFMMVSSSALAANLAVSTVAGGGSTGVSARAASIGRPSAAALDKSGNLYIADEVNHRVYKVDNTGTLTVIAGNGTPGNTGDGGPAVDAQINSPTGVAVDSSGNIYIADSYTASVRKVDHNSGNIKTVFSYYSVNGGVAVDSSGNIFFAVTDLCQISEFVAATGQIQLYAGFSETGGYCGYSGDGGKATQALIAYPTGLSLDAKGNLFFDDSINCVIRRVDANTHIITTVAGNGKYGYSGDKGPATSAELAGPIGVFVDGSGNIFIADTDNDVIREVTNGKIYTIAGNGQAGYAGDGGLATGAELSGPSGVATDRSGNLFIADEYNSVIRKVAASTKTIGSYAGNGFESYASDGRPATSAQINGPAGAFVDLSGNIFIADTYSNVIRKVSASTGKISTVAGNGSEGYSGDGGSAVRAELAEPCGVFVDGFGNIYIADTYNNVIREVAAPTGEISTVAGNGSWGYIGDGGPALNAQLSGPCAVFVDRTGNMFIADSYNSVVREVEASTGKIVTVAGNGAWGYSGDGGAAIGAAMKFPAGLFVDASGNIFIADSDNHVVQEVTASTGKIRTVAGNGTPGYSGDGNPATSAQLNTPSGVYVDGGGNIFITDSANNVVREVAAATGVISTVAGDGKPGFIDSSTAKSAEFNFPSGLTGDRLNNLFAADSKNQRIRKIAGIQGTVPKSAAPPPTFSLVAGVYPGTKSVTLTDSVSGATIYYTTDGKTPTTSSTVYKGPISVASSETIKAVAIAPGYSLGPVATAAYTITAAAPAPTLSPAQGTYYTPQLVTLADAVPGAAIHYTTDGTKPKASSPLYTKPISVSRTTTIKAIAVASGFSQSSVAGRTYTIEAKTAMPTFSPPPRGYWTTQSVTLAAAGAVIYYTTDGSNPTTKSTRYKGVAIPVAKTTTIKAVAVAVGEQQSDTAVGVYTIDDASSVAQRAIAQQGMGMALATQTLLSQISLAFNVLLYSSVGNGGCGKADEFPLGQQGYTGSLTPWAPTSPESPGYATIFYDNYCKQPWMKSELTDWKMSISGGGTSFAGSTNETADFFGPSGSALGKMTLSESIDITMKSSAGSMTNGLGVFTPANGGPPAQLGLACSMDLIGFLNTGEPANCYGAIAQDFKNLDLSLGFVLPLTFMPVTNPGIVWSGTQLVAVSAAGWIFTSPNGTAWTVRSSGTSAGLVAVAWSGKQFVAVGSSGTILTSPDGSKWTSQSSGTSASLASVAWSGKQFVAVGSSGTILTSPDGSKWTSQPSGTKSGLQSVVWSGSKFVAVGAQSTFLTSTSGQTWTSSPPPTGDSTDLSAVTWSETLKLFVAVGQTSIFTSTDGETWTYLEWATSPPGDLLGITWSGDQFVAVGKQGGILTSTDGTDWTLQTSPTTLGLKAVTWTGTQFVAIGYGNIVLTSANGVNWAPQTSAPGYGQVLRFSSSGSSMVTGALGSLKLTAPTTGTLAISGGTAYGKAVFDGHAGDSTIFPPLPTGWTVVDNAHDQKFQITVTDNATRQLTGTITKVSSGKTLVTFTLDRSGTGTIKFSDGATVAVTNWLQAD
jgi:photosystem II stability/assembly factor-like uncharacterized protein